MNINKFLQRAGFSFGNAELISRSNLSWYFGLPDDGRLLAGGILPYVIEWQTNSHPSIKMADVGCRFQQLEIYHPHLSWLQAILESIGAANLVTMHALPKNKAPYLVAHIDTPLGVRTLQSDVSNA